MPQPIRRGTNSIIGISLVVTSLSGLCVPHVKRATRFSKLVQVEVTTSAYCEQMVSTFSAAHAESHPSRRKYGLFFSEEKPSPIWTCVCGNVLPLFCCSMSWNTSNSHQILSSLYYGPCRLFKG